MKHFCLVICILFYAHNSFGKNSYFPQELSNLQFGMSCHSVSTQRHMSSFEKEMNFRVSAIDSAPDSVEIAKITYYFGILEDQPLYSVSIQYQPDVNVEQIAVDLFGVKGEEEMWILESAQPYAIRAWVFTENPVVENANNLVITAAVPSTGEWYEHQKIESEEVFSEMFEKGKNISVLCPKH
ncbi:hypothetical protein [Aliiglaciecola lipolytica]|uniref:hypothetical protein n=1 Tax=Aliiglaciecola lipolytica TaxID=477689 RepID=UPI001C091050|nr:hypothetical protein [Aliiglaciecola lipolytica]MBU2877066.1 hypothetical protein [Aliiglaciecola lipolytica]